MGSFAASVLLATSSTSSSAKTTSGGSAVSFLVLLAVLGVVFWFGIVRPQRNRQRQQQETMSAIGPGDEVVTVGGLVATVVETFDDRVVLLVSPGMPGGGGGSTPVEMTFLRQAIARKVVPEASQGDADGGTESEGEEAEEVGEPDAGDEPG